MDGCLRFRLCNLPLLLAAMLAAFCWPSAALAQSPRPADIEVYVREGCPHCAHAKEFLDQLQQERPGLVVREHAVDQDAEAARRLSELSEQAGVWPPGVPTFVVGDQLIVGFDDAAHTGGELIALLDGRRGTAAIVDSRWFGRVSVDRLGLPLFTLALGLLDGFNPCAMWVLLFLLSLLVHLRNRRRMALIAGTFVFVSGLVYYAFMAAWLNVFLAIGLSNAVRLVLVAVAFAIGLFNLKDFVALGRGFSFSIPEAAKQGIYARARKVIQAPSLATSMAAVAALAVLVNFVELLCTAGLPAIYTAVLAQQNLGIAAHYGYLGLYILGYVTDDSLMVGIAVAALASGKLSERAGRVLKLISGLAMLALGLVLLLRPEWLV